MSRLSLGSAVHFASILLTLVIAGGLPAQLPPDGTWEANAVLQKQTTLTIEGLGAMQGVSFRDGKVYLYGDVWSAKPRVGMIREYNDDYQPTGRVVKLCRGGKPLLLHPTGLTWHERWGTFLGDTVNKNAVIYRLDWKRAWEEGNLDRSVLDIIEDDAAVNGCRPEFVTLEGKPYLATADYGDVHPEVRLYDPEKMLACKRTSAPGVVAHRVLAGPFNQTLHWDASTGQLTCVQNVIIGRGWRLDVLDLAKAVADGRANGPGVRVRMLTFLPHDELEGYRPLSSERGLFVTSSRKNNVVMGEVTRVAPRESRPER
jgi:hypothetical protein